MYYVAIVIVVVLIAMGGSAVYSWVRYRGSQRRRLSRYRRPLEWATEPQPPPGGILLLAVPWKSDFRDFYRGNCCRTK